MTIEKQLNKRNDFYQIKLNQDGLQTFKNEILKSYSKSYSIKKLFTKKVLLLVDKQIFQDILNLINYYNKNQDKSDSFKNLVIYQNNNSIFKIIEEIRNNKIKSKEVIIYINNFDCLIEDIDKIKDNNDNDFDLHFEIDFNNFDFNNLDFNDSIIKKFMIKFFNKSKFTINYKINKDNYQSHQEDILSLYEKSKNIIRFFNLYFDFQSLKNLTVDEMNDFKYYNSFLQRWVKESEQEYGIEITNIKENNLKSSLFVDSKDDVYLDKRFQQNNEYKIFNIYDEINNGEQMDYFELSLLYQQLILKESSFIRNFGQHLQPLIYDQIDYYYNFNENKQIEHLSQEVEFFHYTVLRNFNTTAWTWRNY